MPPESVRNCAFAFAARPANSSSFGILASSVARSMPK